MMTDAAALAMNIVGTEINSRNTVGKILVRVMIHVIVMKTQRSCQSSWISLSQQAPFVVDPKTKAAE